MVTKDSLTGKTKRRQLPPFCISSKTAIHLAEKQGIRYNGNKSLKFEANNRAGVPMKLLHIADLHIGKRVNEFSMLEDQSYILGQILRIAAEEKPSAVLIAGDVYDKSQPSAEAVEVLDDFLTRLVELKQPVFLISGNHDSPERINFGSRIMNQNQLYISGVFTGKISKKSLADEFGVVNFYLLPFIKPAHVRPFFEQPMETYEEALRTVITNTPIEKEERNVLVAHQFVTFGSEKPEESESEISAVGGLDNVDGSVFDAFDYVALGHLHGPQKIGRDTIRYAGSPLKYSFSEVRHHKSVTLIEMGRKTDIACHQIPLSPLRDMREIRGPLAQLLETGRTDKNGSLDYIRAVVTDEEEIFDAVGRLRQVYPNLMNLMFENSKTAGNHNSIDFKDIDIKNKSPLLLFEEFYEKQNQECITEIQKKILVEIIERAGGIWK